MGGWDKDYNVLHSSCIRYTEMYMCVQASCLLGIRNLIPREQVYNANSFPEGLGMRLHTVVLRMYYGTITREHE